MSTVTPTAASVMDTPASTSSSSGKLVSLSVGPGWPLSRDSGAPVPQAAGCRCAPQAPGSWFGLSWVAHAAAVRGQDARVGWPCDAIWTRVRAYSGTRLPEFWPCLAAGHRVAPGLYRVLCSPVPPPCPLTHSSPFLSFVPLFPPPPEYPYHC